MSLAHDARVGVWADDVDQVRALEEAAGEAGVTLPVYVEVNMVATAAASSRASPHSHSPGLSPGRRT
jgi:D-serine deaminase-like pyridoxal phosphate-dependent protein